MFGGGFNEFIKAFCMENTGIEQRGWCYVTKKKSNPNSTPNLNPSTNLNTNARLTEKQFLVARVENTKSFLNYKTFL